MAVRKQAQPAREGALGSALRRFRRYAYDQNISRDVRVDAGVDRVMMVIILALLCLGLIMVFSASYADAQNRYGDSFYFIKRQLISAALGLVVMLALQKADFALFRYFPFVLYPLTTVMLVAVLFVGRSEGVAKRWIYIGPISFQPSELAKLTLVVTLAWYMAKYREKVCDYHNRKNAFLYGVFWPLVLIGFLCLLVMLEHHLSGVIILGFVGILIMFLGGTRLSWLLMAGGVAAVGVTALALFTDYTKRRVNIWLNPGAYPLDGGWQTLQGLRAIGSGGLFGLGLGASRQKYSYVSQPQNDFIFTIWCEELGFIGAIALMLLFAAFVWRGYVIAMRAPDMFSSLVVFGIVSRIALQVLLNVAVVTNTIPNTGISLPFFSYGGTSLMILMVEMGIVLSISRCSRQRR